MSGYNSITGYDPLLGSPENPTTRLHVQPLTAITPPSPVVYVAKKHYICTVPNASMHRWDGARIGFRFGYLETDVEATQQYLDTEIRSGNTFVRAATPEEIQEAKMRMDPRSAIREQVMQEVEADLRIKLEAEIRAKLGITGANVDESIVDSIKNEEQNGDSSQVSARGIAGIDALEQLKRSQRVTKVPGATVIMKSEAAPLKGIVGSDSIKDAAAGSA